MNPFKFIYLTLGQLARQLWLLPTTIGNAVKHKREQVARKEFEVERLDRIRNPSKYLGK